MNTELLYFSAGWCAPCRTLAPIIETFKSECSKELQVIKVDVDERRDLATKHGVRSIPTIIYLVDGVEVRRKTGNASLTEVHALVAA